MNATATHPIKPLSSRLGLASRPALTLRDVLRNKAFRSLWLAQFVSNFGDFLALFGVVSLITFRLHGNARQVMAVTLAYALPRALVSPPAGVLVDRWNVKRVMVASDLIRCCLALLLVAATSIREICAILTSMAVVSSFFNPAESVALTTLVPKERLLAAHALMWQAFYVVKLVSPALAGALVVGLSEKSCFYIDALTFVFSAAMLSSIHITRSQTKRQARENKTIRGLISDFCDGNRFIFHHKALTFVFSAAAMAMFVLSSFSPLISIYIRDSLAGGSLTFGILNSIVGAGLIMGAQVVNRAASHLSAMLVVIGLLGLGLGSALLGGFHSVPMAAVSAIIMGFAIALVLVPGETLPQQETPPDMTGRVCSSFASLTALSQALGLIASAYLAEALGVRGLFLASAAMLFLLGAGGGILLRGTWSPAARSLDVRA